MWFLWVQGVWVLDLVSELLRVCGGEEGQGKAEELGGCTGRKSRQNRKVEEDLEGCVPTSTWKRWEFCVEKEGALEGPGRSKLVCMTRTAGTTTSDIRHPPSSPAAT